MSIKYALIDDEPAFYHLFVDLVKEKIDEDELVFFNQSEEFLKCVNGEHYDVIFMDIDMPGMDGISIAKDNVLVELEFANDMEITEGRIGIFSQLFERFNNLINGLNYE